MYPSNLTLPVESEPNVPSLQPRSVYSELTVSPDIEEVNVNVPSPLRSTETSSPHSGATGARHPARRNTDARSTPSNPRPIWYREVLEFVNASLEMDGAERGI